MIILCLIKEQSEVEKDDESQLLDIDQDEANDEQKEKEEEEDDEESDPDNDATPSRFEPTPEPIPAKVAVLIYQMVNNTQNPQKCSRILVEDYKLIWMVICWNIILFKLWK